jgi:hypothetical protein
MPDAAFGLPHEATVVNEGSSSNDKCSDTESPLVNTLVRPALSCNWYDTWTLLSSWYTLADFSNTLTWAALFFTVEPADPPTTPIDVPPTLAWNENVPFGSFDDSKPKVRAKSDEVEATPRSFPSGNAEPLCTMSSGFASAT